MEVRSGDVVTFGESTRLVGIIWTFWWIGFADVFGQRVRFDAATEGPTKGLKGLIKRHEVKSQGFASVVDVRNRCSGRTDRASAVRIQFLLVYATITQNASLIAASFFVQCCKSASPPHQAPVINRGPTCFAMLKPKRLANQSIAYTKQGERRSSV